MNRQATKAAVPIFLTGLLSGLSGKWATILDNAHPCCLRAFAFIADNNKQILAFSQIVNASIAKYTQMHKRITLGLADINKAIAFFNVEKFNYATHFIFQQFTIICCCCCLLALHCIYI